MSTQKPHSSEQKNTGTSSQKALNEPQPHPKMKSSPTSSLGGLTNSTDSSRNQESNSRHGFTSGAARSIDGDGAQFSLICPLMLNDLAATCREGLVKYGADNWAKGMPINDTLNHAIRHINLFRGGDKGEDHLAHAIWNLMAVIHFSSNCNCHGVRRKFTQLDEFYAVTQPRGL